MAFAAWAASQVKGLLSRLADKSVANVLEESATQAQVAVLCRSCNQHTSLEHHTAAAARQVLIDIETTGLIDALAEAAADQLW
jgi:hypothetical protein